MTDQARMRGGSARERELDRLLERTFAGRTDVAASCPDAETMAAWVGGAVTTAERTRVDAHIGDCARCQETLAVMARMPSMLPDTTPRWSVRRVLFWIAPLASAAAAVAVWVAVHPWMSTPTQRAQFTTVSTQPAPVTTPTAAASEPARTLELDAPAAPHRVREEQRPQRRASADTVPRANASAAEPMSPTPQPVSPTPQPVSPTAVSETRLRENAPAVAAPAAHAQGESASSARAENPAKALAARADLEAAKRTAVQNQKTLSAADAAGPSARLAARSSVIEIAALDPSVRWRITAGRRVEHSTDGGATWGTELEATGQITAGASPGASICWLVGRGGLVLLSVDGHSWRRVQFPEAVDLIGVRPVDATTTSVTTADGRTFTTHDGGATWAIPPPVPPGPPPGPPD